MTDDPETAFETERQAAQELLAEESITAMYVGVVSDGDALETTFAQTADDPQQEGLQALSLLAAHVRLVANEAGVEPAAVAGDAATLAGRMDELSPRRETTATAGRDRTRSDVRAGDRIPGLGRRDTCQFHRAGYTCDSRKKRMSVSTEPSRVETGVPRADDVLDGGLRPASATLVRGAPGAGKTIFGLHFLTTGSDPDETGLYINLGEPAGYLRETAESFGLDVDDVEFLDLSPSGSQFQNDTTYDLFRSGEVETPSLVDSIREEIEAIDPDRVVIDPVTEIRHLAPDERQFRTQVLGLLDFLKAGDATILLTSQAAPSIPDDDLQFLVDAVIDLRIEGNRRTLSVSKFRGSDARAGPHTVTIDDEGMHLWPVLDPSVHERDGPLETLSSGVDELDALLDGGITTGTIGEFRATEQRVSHLADSIVVLRHVEYKGELRKVIGVLKMRTSDFETGLRMLGITGEGLVVGDPLTELRGILTGTPDWHEGD